ncbi:NUDIX domain-containing protein [Actinomadura sp. 9N407]|uniref:NUDIX domain-containing protein n=1 Tax=Actinomadura sp. 9N407 TaxID=3375154 RepID=UPI0037B5AEF2
MAEWVDPEVWWAKAPHVFMSAACLVSNGNPDDGAVLLVKPSYRAYWQLPGGIVEHAERPQSAAARELSEEAGVVTAVPDRLLVMHWMPPRGDRPVPMLNWIFHAPAVQGFPKVVSPGEISDVQFVQWDQAEKLLSVEDAPRLPAARQALRQDHTVYISDSL